MVDPNANFNDEFTVDKAKNTLSTYRRYTQKFRKWLIDTKSISLEDEREWCSFYPFVPVKHLVDAKCSSFLQFIFKDAQAEGKVVFLECRKARATICSSCAEHNIEGIMSKTERRKGKTTNFPKTEKTWAAMGIKDEFRKYAPKPNRVLTLEQDKCVRTRKIDLGNPEEVQGQLAARLNNWQRACRKCSRRFDATSSPTSSFTSSPTSSCTSSPTSGCTPSPTSSYHACLITKCC